MAPYSADPLDFDAYSHHVAFRPVLAGLVTRYRSGQYLGVLAQSWSASPDFLTWTFRIRPGLSFSDGQPITASAVAKSFLRLAFLLKSRKSGASPLLHLVGIDSIQTAASSIPGIRAKDDERLEFHFSTPRRQLLDELSFGIYSIASVKDFDSISGKWKDPKKATASGPYQILQFDESAVRLALRVEFPGELRHPHSAREIEIMTSEDSKSTSDIRVDNSNTAPIGVAQSFRGSDLAAISYIHCVSWKNPSRPCSDLPSRIAMREALYREMESRGFKPVRSFFPIIMKDIREFSASNIFDKAVSKGSEVLYRVVARMNPFSASLMDSIEPALSSASFRGVPKNMSYQELVSELDPDKAVHAVDLNYMETSVLVDGAVSDVRFMFQSKEGIRLPDPSGAIQRELSRPEVNLGVVNETLWNDGIIWPLAHMTKGIWVNEMTVDLEELNLGLPPTDLSWIGFSDRQ
ncbi:MAG: hypothetical protein RJB38_2384 [Pseudomonadota bacterium]